MSESIKDGRGRGFLAEVNETHRLNVDSTIQTKEMEIAETGYAFVMSTLQVTLNSINPHLLMYIKNTNSEKNLYLWNVTFSWNGGSTNHNRTMRWGWVIGPDEPSSNKLSFVPANLNLLSGNVADGDFYKWDGVGDGMIYTGGEIFLEENLSQGHSVIETWGIPIIGLNNSVGMVITGEEIGNASVTVRGYYK